MRVARLSRVRFGALLSAAVGVAISAASWTTAAPLLNEDFSSGGFVGQPSGSAINGVNGWTAAVQATLETNANLSYLAGDGSIFIDGGPNAARVGGNNAELANAMEKGLSSIIGDDAGEDEVWFSFLFRASIDNDNRFVRIGPGSSTTLGSTNTTANLVELRRAAAGNSSFPRVLTFNGPKTDTKFSAATTNDTFLVVGRNSRGNHNPAVSTVDDFDGMQLWINPTLNELLTQTGLASSVIIPASSTNQNLNFPSLTRFNFGVGNLSGLATNFWLFDELRVGTTLLSVIPEPGSVGLAITAIAGALIRRRR